jgi:hypothetical protein
MEDPEIAALVARLSRPHPSGGTVIERAAILAAGTDSPAIIDWILDHSGMAETTDTATHGGGLHGSRINSGGDPASRQPTRFVLPAGAFE